MISLQKIFVNMVTDCLYLPALDISADTDWVTHWVSFFPQNRDTAVSSLIKTGLNVAGDISRGKKSKNR